MKKLILFLALFIGVLIFSQKQDSIKQNISLVEKQAEYKGGTEKFQQDIMKNFRTRKVEGVGISKTDVTFIVERDGTISNIKAIGENESFNKEAEHAILKIKTKWKAVTINGKAVRSRFRVPLTVTFN